MLSRDMRRKIQVTNQNLVFLNRIRREKVDVRHVISIMSISHSQSCYQRYFIIPEI